jgi:hypothetical protein
MSSNYDASEFVDGDLQGHSAPHSVSVPTGQAQRAPTLQEVDAELARTQQELAEKIREKEAKERERAALEETRRRQVEFQTGRQEMIQNLTRGVGLLEETEFAARRDAEQMAKALVELREAQAKIQAINEDTWTKDTFNVELTRALTTLENARMEWNAARLKFPVLSSSAMESGSTGPTALAQPQSIFATYGFGELCRLGFAITWPVAAVGVLILAALLALLMRH